MSLRSLALMAAMTLSCVLGAADRNDKGAESLGLKLSLQAWTAHHTNLWETIDIAQTVGFKYIELFPGQTIGGGIEGKFDHNSGADVRAKVLARLTEAGIKPVAYGVVGLGKDEAGNRKVFDFAKAMGIQVIVSEPSEDSFEVIEKLVKEYDIKVALHDHPKPSRYWNPDHVLETVGKLDPRIGACADTGHWPRSSLDPVEAITKLMGRIMSSHLKETDKIGDGARDIVYGTSTASKSVKDQLAAFKAVGFRGPLSVEYEANKKGQELLDHLKIMVKYFDDATTELAK
jgi:sugar phosphate isomerase/epimerase